MLHKGYLWNSGIFVWRTGDFLGEIRDLTPEISEALAAHAGENASLEDFFAAVSPVSVDVGVLERSARVRVITGDFRMG